MFIDRFACEGGREITNTFWFWTLCHAAFGLNVAEQHLSVVTQRFLYDGLRENPHSKLNLTIKVDRRSGRLWI